MSNPKSELLDMLMAPILYAIEGAWKFALFILIPVLILMGLGVWKGVELIWSLLSVSG